MQNSETAQRLWAAFALLVLFLALPGPVRSPFSGIPLSSKAHLIAAALLVTALTMSLFPPRHGVRGRWLLALALVCAAKMALSPLLRAEGWRGEYWTSQITRECGVEPLAPVRFFWRGARDHRIDPTLVFNDINFALFYVNDWPLDWAAYLSGLPRHIVQPLRVHWTGYVEPAAHAAFSTSVTANGSVAIDIDGTPALRVTEPSQAPASRMLSPGTHRIDIVYDKPPDAKPLFSLAPLPFPVTPVPTPAAALSRSHLSADAIDLLGIVALLAFAGAVVGAYRPIATFLLDEVWISRDRIVVVAFVGVMLFAGVKDAIDARGATMPLSTGDDPLVYEGNARTILFHGLLMKHSAADTRAYYHYPLYPYVLATAHVLFGEDFASVRFFNWICLAATAVLLWTLLRKWLTPGSLILVVIAFGVFTCAYLAAYVHTAFTDNLYLPMCVATVLAIAVALERKRAGWLFVAGVLTALGAATRPSLLIHAPFVVLAVLLYWPGSVFRRGAAAGAFTGGFAAALVPFTLRNWIVAHQFVPVISSYIMLPFFLYAPGTAVSNEALRVHSASGAIRAFFHIFAQDPARCLWVETRKVLFTLGFTRVFGFAANPLLLALVPPVFLLAVWARRIPRSVLIAIVTFLASHMTAMVVASPWSYGYKTILPFHLMLAAGAAFLLPRYGEVAARQVVAPRTVSSGRKSVSVVLPTYNEKDSIRQVIVDFFATGIVDEVIVVNNNAAPGTSEEVAGTGAREVFERRQGYGRAIRRGFDEAKGDYVVICEPDGTFLPRDIFKLLAYADDFDVVYGSRTSQELVWRGANMGAFLRWGNWAVAKYMEFLFNATSLTDVGCTMRLIRRDVAESLRNEFQIEGNQFGPEMMVLTLRHRYRVVQVPVNYLERVGVSAVTGDQAKAFRLGLQMIWLITKHRFAQTSRSLAADRGRASLAEGDA
jgi:Glycosyl transferase family 2/Dolichyl-phosphate-mannose-protein mannosyltransferase